MSKVGYPRAKDYRYFYLLYQFSHKHTKHRAESSSSKTSAVTFDTKLNDF
jgi:hypothetical protein